MDQDIIAIGDRRAAAGYLQQIAATHSPLAQVGSLRLDPYELRVQVAAMPAEPRVDFLQRRKSDGELFLFTAGSKSSVHIKSWGGGNAAEIFLEADAHFETILGTEAAPDTETVKSAQHFFARLLPCGTPPAETAPAPASILFRLPGGEFIRVSPTGLESNLIENDDSEHDAAVHGLEALLLAMAGHGVALDTPEMHQAVEAANEAIANQFA